MKIIDKTIKKFDYEKIMGSNEYQNYKNKEKQKKRNKKIRFADWDKLVRNGSITI